MRAGQLNRRVSVRSPGSTARSTDGAPIISWTTVLDTVWADRQTVSAREMFAADVRWAAVTRKYVLRYSSAVTPECRLIDLDDSSSEWNIEAVIDIRDEGRGLEILAKRAT